jgi:hypothetical protein
MLYQVLGVFSISNFRRVLNVVCFLLGNSPASEFYIKFRRQGRKHTTFRHVVDAKLKAMKFS